MTHIQTEAKLDQPASGKPSIWAARVRFEQEQGLLAEDFELPPRAIAETTWRNPLEE
jgi:hypothetical protein